MNYIITKCCQTISLSIIKNTQHCGRHHDLVQAATKRTVKVPSPGNGLHITVFKTMLNHKQQRHFPKPFVCCYTHISTLSCSTSGCIKASVSSARRRRPIWIAGHRPELPGLARRRPRPSSARLPAQHAPGPRTPSTVPSVPPRTTARASCIHPAPRAPGPL